jgi:hypothetical protein
MRRTGGLWSGLLISPRKRREGCNGDGPLPGDGELEEA